MIPSKSNETKPRIKKDVWYYQGVRVISEWHESRIVPKEYSQVNTVSFTDDGKIILISTRSGKAWNIPGGKPEKGEDYKMTAAREADEEASIDIVDVQMIGYMTTTIPKNDIKDFRSGTFNQLRCYARVDKIKKLLPDPDGDLLRKRKIIPHEEFNKYIKWGDVSKEMYRLALKEYLKNADRKR